ncbi:MAG: TrmH family RNA methyltransferase, partial [Salinispira sp.]
MNKQVLYILHDIEEFLRSTGRVSACDLVYTEKLNRREKDILSVLKKRNIASRQVPEREFKNIAAETFSGDLPKHLRHILLFCPAALLQSSKPLSALWPLVDGMKHSVILILAGITDPHNLGAIIRNADIFEASAVILPKRRSAVMNETVRRVSAGAGHHVRVFTVANIVRIIEQLKE